MKLSLKSVLSTALVMVVFGPGFSMAQSEMATIEEIFVNAQKRVQNINDIPVSVSAFSGDIMEQNQMETVEDLQYLVPGLRINGFLGRAKANFSIRGAAVSDSWRASDPQPFAVHMDDVFISNRSAQIFQMFDLERVEVGAADRGIYRGCGRLHQCRLRYS